MASSNFFPRRDLDVLHWTATFKELILAQPGEYGLSVQQAEDYAVTQQAFAEALQVATAPATNSRGNVLQKNILKRQLEDQTRALARQVRATPSVTNPMRATLNLSLTASGRGPDVAAPVIRLVGNVGRAITVRIADPLSPRRGKPRGVAGAVLFAYLGEQPPADPDDWEYKQITTRTKANVEFPTSLPVDTPVWLTAQWYSTRAAPGPLANPILTTIPNGMGKPRSLA